MFGWREFKGFFSQGNRITLLENGEEFFPQLIRRIKHAQREIFLETFILADDRVGQVLQKALIRAAHKGVWVSLTVDSWGSHSLNSAYIDALVNAGVVFQIYDPQPEWYRGRPKLLRRLHRKLAIIDGKYAFTGGINLCYDHVLASGPEAMRDYAVELQGPAVAPMRELCKSYVRDAHDKHLAHLITAPSNPDARGSAKVAFVSRDNRRNRSNIEKAYLAAIAQAKKRIWISNAYFFPGYRFIRALRLACKRGVDVRLILQGNPDVPFSLSLARTLYDKLIHYGVNIYEYRTRPLHAKIAVIDDQWATIGSSNLDPLSLAFNLEANVVVYDKNFNQQLAQKINTLAANSLAIERHWLTHRRWYLLLKDFFMYHTLRHFPTYAGLLPAYIPKMREIKNRHKTAEGKSYNKKLRRQYPESRGARRVIQKCDYDTGEHLPR